MMNDDSIPVWMLADTFLALLVAGSLGAVTLLPYGANSLARDLSEKSREIADLEKQLEESGQSIRTLLKAGAEKKTLADGLAKDLQGSTQEVRRLTAQVEQFRADTTRNASSEKGIRQEFIGIKGDMHRTLFIVDISGSMATEFSGNFIRANWLPGETAWSNVKRKIGHFLELLPVTNFRIICFNAEFKEFPEGQEPWSKNRSAAMDFLNQQKPEGMTATEKALQRAVEFNPTSIILLTDGHPTRVNTTKSASGEETSVVISDPEQQQRILQMATDKVFTCPVNVVALNDYSDPTFLNFLQELAGRTGGAFLGY